MLTVDVRVHEGATVVEARGQADATTIAALRDAVVSAASRSWLVVVELDEVQITEPTVLEAVIEQAKAVGGPERVRIAVRRHTAVTQITRWRIHHAVPVHATVAEAIDTHRRDWPPGR